MTRLVRTLCTWEPNFVVGHFDYGDRQVAYQEGEEYGKNHLRDAPLITFRLQFSLFLGLWLGFGSHGRVLSHPAL